jgi:hypothetical protein
MERRWAANPITLLPPWGVFFQTSGERITAFVRETAQEFQKQSAEEPAIDEAGKRPIQP